jgi:hypothetical protein
MILLRWESVKIVKLLLKRWRQRENEVNCDTFSVLKSPNGPAFSRPAASNRKPDTDNLGDDYPSSFHLRPLPD